MSTSIYFNLKTISFVVTTQNNDKNDAFSLQFNSKNSNHFYFIKRCLAPFGVASPFVGKFKRLYPIPQKSSATVNVQFDIVYGKKKPQK